MSYFGREYDNKAPLPTINATTGYVITPTTQTVRPEDHDSGNVDIKLVPSSPLGIGSISVVPIKIKPQSLVHEPWTSFGPLENRLFLDDFCHDKELTVKASAATYNGATIKVKEAANIKKGEIKLKEQVKVWFPLYSRWASALHFKLTNAYTRVHYDHGVDIYNGHKVNLYGSFGFDRDWNKYNGKFGFTLLENKTTVDNRFALNQQKTLSWFHRTTTWINEFRLGLVLGVNLTNKDIVKKDILIGYQKNEVDLTLKAEQGFGNRTLNYGDWRQWFNKYVLTTVYRRSKKQRFGVQVTANPKTNQIIGTALIEYLYSDKGFTKIKLDTLLNLTLMVKKTMTDKMALSFGTLIPLSKSGGERNKFGIQVDLNI